MKRFFLIFLIFLAACGSGGPEPIELSRPGYADVARGRYISNALAACGRCHSKDPQPYTPLSGGGHFYDEEGEAYGSNLTPSETGLASWKFFDIYRAIKLGKFPDGSAFNVSAHKPYLWMSDADLNSVVAYLMSLSPVTKEVQRRSSSFTSSWFGNEHAAISDVGYVAEVKSGSKLQNGKYFVDSVAGCWSCHDGKSWWGNRRYLAGGEIFMSDKHEFETPAINASALKSWSVEQILEFLRTGKKPNGKSIKPDTCPVSFYVNATTDDLKSIAIYLKSVQ